MVQSLELIVQTLPPRHDAIGEYTQLLAEALSGKSKVRILFPYGNSIPNCSTVNLVSCFHLTGLRRFNGLFTHLCESDSDAVILQYNPFCWGKRGWATDLVRAFNEVRQKRPDLLIGVMFHETYTMNPGWRARVLRSFQYRQYQSLCRLADVLFFSTEVWAESCRNTIRDRPVIHLPVGSNLPRSVADRDRVRQKFGIPSEAFICGVFGGAHPSRMIDRIESAVRRLVERLGLDRVVHFLHIGGEPIAWNLGQVPILATGRLPAEQASDAIATLDMMINPFSDGVSTRRGSVIAALQNGVPVLTTYGHHTDRIWSSDSGNGVFLGFANSEASWIEATDRAIDAVLHSTAQTRSQTQRFFDRHFTWDRIANTVLETLQDAARSRSGRA